MSDPPARPRPPEFTGILRRNLVRIPEEIRRCSGIVVLGKRIKSLLFTTDVAIIRNHNADAVIAVYPFTPQPAITHALMTAADVPVFCGVGGGVTSGRRSIDIARDAEFHGALGVVLNQPAPSDLVRRLKRVLEIPVIVTVVSARDDIDGRVAAGVDILNVSGAQETPAIVAEIRRRHPDLPLLATGGRDPAHIASAIDAGANAITYTPPSSAELFRRVMEGYRATDRDPV
jgi:isopentenyl diphosphate isomerase/L-lactate dehydrogenase-like FMN-dependent dehydrogenase